MKKEKRIDKIYSLTPMQEGMLFHFLKDKESSAYFEQFLFTLKGEVDKSLLEESYNLLIERHDILRTVFVYDKIQKPKQVVLENVNTGINFEDISCLKEDEKRLYLEEFKRQDRERGFDLTRDLLMRVYLFKTGTDSYKLLWSSHHITMDGWSSGIFVKELMDIYRSLIRGERIRLTPAIPFRNYVKWLEKQDKDEGLNYWKRYLEGYEQQAALPKFGTPMGEKKYKKEEYHLIIDEVLTSRLNKLADEYQVTVNTVFQTLWGILLQEYNNCDDVVFGAVVSGRPSEIDGIENMVGLFINTIPVRIKSGHHKGFPGLLKEIQKKAIKTQSYEYLPLADIQSNSPLKGNLIEHIMVFENFSVQDEVKNRDNARDIGFMITGIFTFEQTNYDFNMMVLPGKTMTVKFSYNSFVYDDSLIKRTALHFEGLMKQVVENPDLELSCIEIIGEREKRELLEISEGKRKEVDTTDTIHRLFEEKAGTIAEETALVFKGKQLTYGELNKQSNRLARTLRVRGAKPGAIIGLMLTRSFEMITGIIGILKSGGACLPIDPDYPENRKKYMLEDSRVDLLLTNYDSIPGSLPDNIEVLDLRDEGIYEEDGSNPDTICSGSDLLYVIYTSGSTGKPKGVMLEHRNMVNLVKFQFGYTNIDFSRVLQFTTISFDVSFQEIFSTLLYGGKLYLVDSETRNNIPQLFNIVGKNKIKTLFSPASYLKFIFSEEDYWTRIPGSIEHIVTAGEQVVVTETFRNYLKRNRVYLHNHYGPSETHVVTTLTLEPGNEIPHLPPIGKPIMNTDIYLFDKNKHLQPLGVIGELYIGGLQVGRGYWGRDDLTREKFIDSPFAGGGRLYRTGDLARWLSDGNIEFIGRLDHQVKIRGFRIEPGEIESLLRAHREVKEAVVIPRSDETGNNYLCAYVVYTEVFDKRSSIAVELKKYLSGTLPEYMVPSYFVRLDKIPLTPNNKVDREKLPEPDLIATGEKYIAPRNEIEEKLAEIWADILINSRDALHASIGIEDNFFDLGGHSLKATVLMSRIHKEFNVIISLAEIFKMPTIKQIAGYIGEASKDKFIPVEPIEKKEYYPLSSAQKRLYFLHKMGEGSTGYNMPQSVILEGELEKEKLEETFRKLIERHESLRTSFHIAGEEPVQKIDDTVEFEIEYYDLTRNKVEAEEGKIIQNSFVRSFNLMKAPLLRIGIIKTGEARHILMLDMHHIITDGVSRQVVAKEFMALYAGEELEPLRIHYKDYAHRQNSEEEKERIKKQAEYWLNEFRGDIPVLNLPTDYTRPAVQSFEGSVVCFSVDREETARVKKLAEKENATLFMVLLGVFNVLLSKLSSQEDIVVGTPIAGRRHAELEQIIGMFVNTLALRNYPWVEKTFKDFLEEIKERTLDAFENQEYQFEDLVDNVSVRRDAGRNPLFDVMFSLQNVDVPEVSIPGLNLLPCENKADISKFDMTLSGIEAGDSLLFSIDYSTNLFKQETIERFTVYFKEIVSMVTRDPRQKIAEIEIIPAKERKQLLYTFNDTQVEYPVDKTIHELFEQQAVRTPDKIAVAAQSEKCTVYNGKAALHGDSETRMQGITYKELSEKSNRLANYLILEKNIQPENRVGIVMSQSIERIVAILGIMKAGGAYVPIDHGLPEERIKNIVNNAEIGVVISQEKEIQRLNWLQWECESFHTFLCLDVTQNIYLVEEEEKNELMDEKLWKYIGETSVDEINGGGWLSSYTGKPISKEEMDEYGDNVLEKLMPLLHKKMCVLEIGCASGITMYRIAPHVGFYYGTDLSEVIINKNKKRVEKEGGHQNIALSTLPAHDIDKIKERNYELVIMNSVIHCFHGHNYLRNVIKKAVDLMGDNGFLFIGDVMNQYLKDALIRDISDFKRANQDKSYKTKTDFSQELFVSPDFFKDLIIDIPDIRSIEFSDKIHTIKNELTRYRYDVLIRVDKSRELQVKNRLKHKYQQDSTVLAAYSNEKVESFVSPLHLAYVIYTSGTTGKPKGVMIQHRSLVNLCFWHNRYYQVTEADNATQYAGFGFDASVWEIFPYLIKGACIHLISDKIKLDTDALNNYYEKNRITIGFLPTQLCEQFMESKNRSLRKLLTGGDKLRLFKRNNYDLYNNYGPTENTVVTTVYPVEHWENNIPIGRPIDNNRIYILNTDSLQLQPVGVVGELCTAGDSLARGYLNDREQTREKFIMNPHIPDERIYRTGDLARWLPDGNIEFLGRIDLQVKIRGFRIELEEIENQLLKHEGAKEAVVIAKTADNIKDKYLCAYVVPNASFSGEDSLREFLSARLPDYMVPAYFVILEEIPLTPNGKVDRRALPEPEASVGEDHTAPRDEVEKALVRIWADVLAVEKDVIGIDTPFFQLGGHSLKAIVLISKIHRAFDVKVPLTEVFKLPTVRRLSEWIKGAQKTAFIDIEPAPPGEYYELSYNQKRLWIIQQVNPGDTSYNMPGVLTLEHEVDLEAVRKSLAAIIERHESFRTAFEEKDGEPVQLIEETVDIPLEIVDICSLEEGEKQHRRRSILDKEAQTPFDLSRPPLFRAQLIKWQEDRWDFVFNMHHIISDGWSHEILKRDFTGYYEVFKSGGEKEFEPLRLQYKDFAAWQNRQIRDPRVKEKSHRFWLSKLKEGISRFQLPYDFSENENDVTGASYRTVVDNETREGLKKIAADNNTTLFIVMFSVYNWLLSRFSGQNDIVCSIISAGREHAALQDIVGFFINSIAARITVDIEEDFDDFLHRVDAEIMEFLQYQGYPPELVLDELKMPYPDVPVSFNMLNMQEVSTAAELELFDPYHAETVWDVKFSLALHTIEYKNGIEINWIYKKSLFNPATIELISGRYLELLKKIAGNPEEEEMS